MPVALPEVVTMELPVSPTEQNCVWRRGTVLRKRYMETPTFHLQWTLGSRTKLILMTFALTLDYVFHLNFCHRDEELGLFYIDPPPPNFPGLTGIFLEARVSLGETSGLRVADLPYGASQISSVCSSRTFSTLFCFVPQGLTFVF